MSEGLQIGDIVSFWADRQTKGDDGRWCHDLDRRLLSNEIFGFNLDYPVSPYVGNIAEAKVVILNLNGGFDPVITPSEFATPGSTDRWLSRVSKPANSNWHDVSIYYDRANYGAKIRSGEIALINACAYRSSKLSNGPTRTLAERLPSVLFHRRWLREALIPLANDGRRVILANRWGLWKISKNTAPSVIFDPAPVSANISAATWIAVAERLKELKLQGN